jgi:hypothetical protein
LPKCGAATLVSDLSALEGNIGPISRTVSSVGQATCQAGVNTNINICAYLRHLRLMGSSLKSV